MSRRWTTGAQFSARVFGVSLCICLLDSGAFAQRAGLNDPQHLNDVSLAYDTAPGTGVLIFNVYAERASTRLDRQALLKLVNSADRSATFQTTEDNAQGVFTNIPFGS